MSEQIVTEHEADGVRVLTVNGEVDIANAAELEERLRAAAQGARRLVVSLASCTYMDSSGLRVLIRLSNELHDRFGVVVEQRSQIRRIFDIAGLDLQMNVYDAVDDAVAATA